MNDRQPKSKRTLGAQLALALSLLMTAAPTRASASPAELLQPVDRFVEAFNRWDLAYPEDVFTPDCVVVDIFPPFLWQGRGAPQAWWRALAGDNAAEHARRAALHEHLTHGAVAALQQTDLSAKFDLPATLTYQRGGVSRTITGRWIFTETPTARGWRITSHTWTSLSEQ